MSRFSSPSHSLSLTLSISLLFIYSESIAQLSRYVTFTLGRPRAAQCTIRIISVYVIRTRSHLGLLIYRCSYQ